MYVNPGFKRLDVVTVASDVKEDHPVVVGELPPLKHVKNSSKGRMSMMHLSSSTSNVSSEAKNNSNGGKTGTNSSTSGSGREPSTDPMSLDSGVITTLSRSISPMSSRYIT